jgi:hypothetical protein
MTNRGIDSTVIGSQKWRMTNAGPVWCDHFD